MNNLIKRSITGIIFILILAGAILLGHFSYYVIFLIIMTISLLEFIELTKNIELKIPKIPTLILGIIIFSLTFLEAQKLIHTSWLSLAILPAILTPLFTFIKQNNNQLLEICLNFFGMIYIILPLSLANYIVFPANDVNHAYYPDLLMFIFILIWTHDTFAYITGKYAGKHKLSRHISPAKTWEGTIGGTIISIIVALIIGYFSTNYPIIHFIALPIIISSAATLGDLTESSLKRTAKVKDSGNILPGHGGILDRFDAAFFAIPATFIYIKFFLI
ncbi:MAG: phosphatidate cytidylyltransferase [Bacteroidales bacterium]